MGIEELKIAPVIKYYGDGKQILNSTSVEVVEFDEKLREVADKMANSLYFYSAIGVSAVQIGVLQRLFVIRTGGDKYVAFVNPEITSKSEDTYLDQEGCLSFPECFVPVERSREIVLKYQDLDGKEYSTTLTGLHGRCAQHELDHLNGITFLDHISQLKRDIVRDKMIRLSKSNLLKKDLEILKYMAKTSDNLTEMVLENEIKLEEGKEDVTK